MTSSSPGRHAVDACGSPEFAARRNAALCLRSPQDRLFTATPADVAPETRNRNRDPGILS